MCEGEGRREGCCAQVAWRGSLVVGAFRAGSTAGDCVLCTACSTTSACLCPFRPPPQISTVEERHQEQAEAAAEQKAGGKKRGRGAGAGGSKKAKIDMEALTQVPGAGGLLEQHSRGCCRWVARCVLLLLWRAAGGGWQHSLTARMPACLPRARSLLFHRRCAPASRARCVTTRREPLL